MRAGFQTFVVAFVTLAAAGCAAEGDPEDMTTGDGLSGPCVPGQSMPCECDDGAPGARVCDDEGEGYGACSCTGNSGGAADGAGDGAADGGGGSADGGAAGDDGGASAGDGDPGDGGSDGGNAGPPTWSGDIVPFFEQYCGANNAVCHRREAYAPDPTKGCLGWASFEDASLGSVVPAGENEGAPTNCPDLGLYERLVERSPWQCGAFFGTPSETLIVPGDSSASYMVKKMSAQLMCDDSDPMPPPGSGIVVPPEAMQMFRDWIDAGAPMD